MFDDNLMTCLSCGAVFSDDESDGRCPECKSVHVKPYGESSEDEQEEED